MPLVEAEKKNHSIPCFICSIVSMIFLPIGWFSIGLFLLISIGLAIAGIVLARKTLRINSRSGLATAGMTLSILSLSFFVLTILLTALFGS